MCCNSKAVDVIESNKPEIDKKSKNSKSSKKNSESEISIENEIENKMNTNEDNKYSKFDKKKL